MKDIISYILSFLLRDDEFYIEKVGYTCNTNDFKNYNLVIIPSAFFNKGVYGKPISLPSNNVPLLDSCPILFGSEKIEKIRHSNGETIIMYSDIVASTYFFISRYEEMLHPELKDEHNRFVGRSSWLYRNGFIDTPIVDMYSLILKKYIDLSMGSKAPKENNPKWEPGFSNIYLTHDIDSPYLYRSLKGFLRGILDKKSIFFLLRACLCKFSNDPYYTFPTILSIDSNVKKALSNNYKNTKVQDIYFMKISGTTSYDKPFYSIKSPLIKHLKKSLDRNGAQIGIHLSYLSSGNDSMIKNEIEHINQSYEIKTNLNRHHFLRFISFDDISSLSQAGITDDFTMGFADTAGFRLGTSRAVKAINPVSKSLSSLTYHPLACMDSSLFGSKYMNLSYDKAWLALKSIIDNTFIHGGDLCLLWHNTAFTDPNTFSTPFSNAFKGKDSMRNAGDIYKQACIYISELYNTL